ncbi:hypothetical protein T439DRAFT_329890 [Meredithblackwellia eburnea MCA 4105]
MRAKADAAAGGPAGGAPGSGSGPGPAGSRNAPPAGLGGTPPKIGAAGGGNEKLPDPRQLGFKDAAAVAKPPVKWIPVPGGRVVGGVKGAGAGGAFKNNKEDNNNHQQHHQLDDDKDLSGISLPLPPVRIRPDKESEHALDQANARVRDGDGGPDAGESDDDDDDEAGSLAEADEEEEDEVSGNGNGYDEDGDLDGALRDRKGVNRGNVNKLKKPFAGAPAAKGGGPKQRKKPAMPGAGAGAGAGPQPDNKVKWNGGWSERFKQKQGAALVGPPGDEPPTPPPSDDGSEPNPNPQPKGLLQHPLVARYAAFDFPRKRFVVPSSPDSANKARVRSRLQPFNLTLCALVPSEQRFLPEWLLYHSLLGVERFALYDTSAAGAVGAEEIDGLADRMEEEGRDIQAAPKAEEIKAGIGRTAAGLDSNGKVFPERISGIERWIEQGVVTFHWMKFSDAQKARNFHQEMMQHCTTTYSKSSNFLAHLDVDEFLVLSESLYGTNKPYRETETENEDEGDGGNPDATWRYPLHDFLERSSSREAACIPVPQLRFRNVGVRTLAPGTGVLSAQTKRDVVNEKKMLPEKVLLHTAFSKDFVHFDGPHSCRVNSVDDPPEGVTREIRNSQGELLQDGGVFRSTRLPTEPLSIAHYFQRDLSDCHQKLALIHDPNSLHAKGRGVLECEEHYVPSVEELASKDFIADKQNRFLLHLPEEGTVVEDLRAKESWAGRAAQSVLSDWKTRLPPTVREIESAQDKVVLLLI